MEEEIKNDTEQESVKIEPEKPAKKSKPLHKKWWFWAIVVVILIGAATSGGDKNTTPTSTTPAVSSQSGQPANTASTTPKVEDKSIKAGMYKVGKDIPAGEYVLVTTQQGYFSVNSDSTGTMGSIIANDNFTNRSIITVKDGQYLDMKRCSAYPIADAPAVNTQSGVLEAGMYKVGTDLQPGEYKIESAGSGYVEVSSNSAHSMGAIVSNDNFDGSKYISVKSGQYIKLARAKLYLK